MDVKEQSCEEASYCHNCETMLKDGNVSEEEAGVTGIVIKQEKQDDYETDKHMTTDVVIKEELDLGVCQMDDGGSIPDDTQDYTEPMYQSESQPVEQGFEESYYDWEQPRYNSFGPPEIPASQEPVPPPAAEPEPAPPEPQAKKVRRFARNPCDMCDMYFTTQAELKDHFLTNHLMEKRSMACTLCNYTTSRETSFQKHKVTHEKQAEEEDKPKKMAPALTNTPNSRASQKQRESRLAEGTPERLSLAKASQKQRESRLAEGTPERLSLAKEPPQRLPPVVHHNNNHAKEEVLSPHAVFTCSICPYVSEKRSNVNRHIKAGHKYEDPEVTVMERSAAFSCGFCPYATHTQSNYSKHIMMVHGMLEDEVRERPKAQPKRRSEPAARKAPVIRRDATDPDKPLHCPLCAFRTRYAASLTRHVKTQHTSLAVCPICDIGFEDDLKLVEHNDAEHPGLLLA